MKTVNSSNRVHIFFKECFLLHHTVLLNHFIYSKVKAYDILYGGAIPVRLARIKSKQFLFIWSEEICISFKLFTADPQVKSHKTIHAISDAYWRNTLAYSMSQSGHLPVCKTPGFFFWLIFLASSPPSTTNSNIPHKWTLVLVNPLNF